MTITNDFSISVGTVNGSGSQSANIILAKTLFRMGLPVGAKNLFPSNIAGLPTWFSIRVNPRGFVSRRSLQEIVIAKNAKTLAQDLKSVAPGGFYFYDQDFKVTPNELRQDVTCVPLPYREITQNISDSIKMRKLLTNMVYVGVLAELLQIDDETLNGVVYDQFENKTTVIELNLQALKNGRQHARQNLSHLNFPYRVHALDRNQNKIFIDGNTAAALGAVTGGCTVLSWYPITPSTSLAESYQEFAKILRRSENGENRFAAVQAEDELTAINMVIGAGWAGTRAMTATSGPGLSLMAEAAGLSYFAEIPAVIWDVQRAGPSTGLPTRTMQGDLQFAYRLSHGDTEHIVLLPANAEECFHFARLAFDLAEELQTLVIVLSDLDLGMNLGISAEFAIPQEPYRRGKILNAEALNNIDDFARYRDVDGDGICYRTLPGTLHAKAAYFTRGTGHTEKATYTEDGSEFSALLTRLKHKMNRASDLLPHPLVDAAIPDGGTTASSIGLVAYGSSDSAIPEARTLLQTAGVNSHHIRVRALPLSENLRANLSALDRVYIIEQNRDGQMRGLLTEKFPDEAHKFISILSFDGLPLTAEFVADKILQLERAANDHHERVVRSGPERNGGQT